MARAQRKAILHASWTRIKHVKIAGLHQAWFSSNSAVLWNCTCPATIRPTLYVSVLSTFKKIWLSDMELLGVSSCILFTACFGFGAKASLPLTNDYMMGILGSSHSCRVGLLLWAVFLLDTSVRGSTCLTLLSSPVSSSNMLSPEGSPVLPTPLSNPFRLTQTLPLPCCAISCSCC